MIATVNINIVESAVNKINKLHFVPGTGNCCKESLLLKIELLINAVLKDVVGLLRAWIYIKFGLGELFGLGL